VYYCTVNKEKALHFYEDTTVSCISDTIFYFSLETVLAWRAVQFECGKPLLLVYCHVPYQHCALVSNRLKIYIYILCTFLFGCQHQNEVCIVTDVSLILNVYMYNDKKLFLPIKTFSYAEKLTFKF